MQVHLAEVRPYMADSINAGLWGDTKFNILSSFAYSDDFETYYSVAENLLIDSGAFTFQRKGIKQLDNYLRKYKDFISKYHEYPNVHFFEMDIDNVIGYDKVLEIRSDLLEITDKIIPVWHKSLGLGEYKRMCQTYPYVAFSGVNKEDLLNPEQMYHFVEYAHKHGARVHGLGVCAKRTIYKVPFDSVDGTSWFVGVRYGRYGRNKLSKEYMDKNYKKIGLLNLIQGVKIAKEIEEYWRKKQRTNKN